MTTLGIQSYEASSLALIGNKLWFSSGYNPSLVGNGTGVHDLILDANGDKTGQQSYSYIGTSTTVPTNHCRAVAAYKSGNVWFGPMTSRFCLAAEWFNPFPIAAGGSFTGLVDPGDVINQDLGGHLAFTSTTLGALSGTLKLGNTSQTFKGVWQIPLTGDATAEIQIPGKGETPLSLHLVLYRNEDRTTPEAGIGGTVSEPGMDGESGELFDYRHAWPTGASPAPYKGRYTATLGAVDSPGDGDTPPGWFRQFASEYW
jgi:hypothetical protein